MLVKRIVVAVAMAVVLSLLAVPAQAGKYTPGAGPTFNGALGGGATQRKIVDKIVKTIRSTPRGEQIKIMTWNFQSSDAVSALLKAQRRGVKVNLIMAKGNAVNIDNPSFRALRAGLSRGNKGRATKSWARLCSQSCRGRGGAAHAKYYLFSKSGKARQVVIQGSANLTSAAANNQWNDITTMRNKAGPYNFVNGVFQQMKKDKPVKRTFVQWRGGPDNLMFFPGGTKTATDPVAGLLNRVSCKGASNTGSGRTRIVVAPDALREDRGMALARKLRSLWVQGCDVRIGYTVMGIDIGRMLRGPSKRGPVPLAHLVQDANSDGQFDNYFHMKAMTIVGKVGNKRNTWVTLNGSANFSTSAARSDENLGVYYRKGMTQRYEEHLNYWYNFFKLRGGRYVYARQATSGGRYVDGLLFGEGPIDGVDPYAQLERD